MGKWKGSRGKKKRPATPVGEGGGDGQGGDAAQKPADAWFNLGAPKEKPASWVTDKTNALYEAYYRRVFGFDRPSSSSSSSSSGDEDEAERDFRAMLEAMKKDLPTTLRVTSSSPFEPLMNTKLADFFKPRMTEAAAATEDASFFFERLPWYPDGNAWQLSAGRNEMKKSPIFAQFRRFLVSQTENGNVSRQEAVSMIPPLLLDVKAHHWVLDMCASPGSKTAQMLEAMQKDAGDAIPTGVVVANDVDEKRCYMLVHQIKRLTSPCGLVTNYPAQSFPRIPLTSEAGERHLEFDRILADVPCSGDGTLRKNIDLWGKWHPNLANGIHTLQLRIATRGAHLLKIGGRMIYSTCSLNPVEDEAVVAALLNRAQGALELVDVSKELPELKRRPGLRTWEVYDANKPRKRNRKEEVETDWTPGWYAKHEDLPPRSKRFIHASCFPPTNAADLHLERCMRVYPQDQNTGGFFIAVIKKTAEMPLKAPTQNDATEAEKEPSAATTADDDEAEPVVIDPALKHLVKEIAGKELRAAREGETSAEGGEVKEGEEQAPESRRRKDKRWGKEEPFLPLTETMRAEWLAAKEYYGISDDFPTSQLMVRAEAALSIYYVSDGVKDILFNSANGLRRTINTGMAILKKHAPPNVGCRYRPSQEGLPVLSRYMSKRKVQLTKDEFLTLIKQRSPPVTTFLPATQDALRALDNGGCVFVVPLAELNGSAVEVAGWKAGRCAQLLVNDQDKDAISVLLLIHEDSASSSSSSSPSSASSLDTPTSAATGPSP